MKYELKVYIWGSEAILLPLESCQRMPATPGKHAEKPSPGNKLYGPELPLSGLSASAQKQGSPKEQS